MIFFIIQLIYFGNVGCQGRQHNNEELNLVEYADKVGRNLLQQACGIRIDGCYYAFTDDECRDDYFPDVKIISGEKANIKQYPFFVSLRKPRTNDCGNKQLKCYQHFCGGSLVLEDVVLTAAHCVENFIDPKKIGRQAITEVLLATRESKCKHQDGVEDLFVGWIEIHPNYSPDDDNNDIALLYLKGKIEQSDAIINFIDAKKYENDAELIGNNAGIIGFGYTGLEPDKISLFYSSKLREAWTRVRKFSMCLNLLSDFPNSQFNWSDILDDQTMICTYNQFAGACEGDSGGPLFIKTDIGEYVLLGIMSWGPSGDCFSTQGKQAPNIFTRVSFYKDFILDSIRKSSDSNIENLQMSMDKNVNKNTNFNCSDECSCPEELQCDVEALQAFKNSMVEGDYLLNSWQGTNPCKWDYILCDIVDGNNRRVVQVDMVFAYSTNTMSASLVPEFSKLRFIDKFYLTNQNIIGQLLEEYSVLDKLTEFNTSQLQLTGTLPSTYSTWTNLQGFECGKNSIKGKINRVKEWSQWANLQNLNIAKNKLQGKLVEQFSTWTNLETLSIRNNQFKGTLTPAYSTWEKVMKLDIMENDFFGTLPPEYSATTSMMELRAAGNDFKGVLPPQWSSLENISILDIERSPLSGTLPAEYSSMTAITEVLLSANKLSGSFPIEYSAWRLCTKIHLVWNKITGTMPPQFSKMSRLESLDVRSNKITGTMPPQFSEMSNMKFFQVGYNAITGTLPPEYSKMSKIKEFFVGYNEDLSGALPPEYSSMRFLERFYARDTNLQSIKIPYEWSVFTQLDFGNDRQFQISLPYDYDTTYILNTPMEYPSGGWKFEPDTSNRV